MMKSVSYNESLNHEYRAVKEKDGTYTVLEDGKVIATELNEVMAYFLYPVKEA